MASAPRSEATTPLSFKPSGVSASISSTLLHQHPTAVVENLGSNDAIQATTHPDWHTGFEHMVAMLAPTTCVPMTTINTFLDAPHPSSPVASEINRAVEDVASTRPNFHVVDWNAAIHAPNGGSLLSADLVHPSATGQITLAALIRTALDRDCRFRPTP